MRFMSLIKSAELNQRPPQSLLDAMDNLLIEARQAGVMVDTGGLAPTATGFRMRISKGKISVHDGPFTEAKEVVGGYAILNLPSRDAALEWTRKFIALHGKHWPEWEGEAEVRAIFSPDDLPPHG
jgi:hypothetical protein